MSESESIRLCAHCRGEIPESRSSRAKYCSDECRRLIDKEQAKERMRIARKKDPQKYYERTKQWKKNNPERVKEIRAKGSAKRKRLGIKYVDNRTYEERREYYRKRYGENYCGHFTWERNARQAWEYWLKVKAPDWWLDRYYQSMGKPWRDHRLTHAQKYKLRYWADDAFRQRQIHKAGTRKERLKPVNDQTHDYHLLLKERKTCPYCGVKLNKDNRVIDHMDPVAKHGAHSMANMVVCCIPCNQNKRDKDFLEWIDGLKPVFKARALSVYTRKHGRPPSQNGFDLVFNEE